VSTDRTPDERALDAVEEARVSSVLDQTVEDYASWRIAEADDLDPEVCERWINAVWDGLRDNLDDQERLHAIVILLRDRSVRRAAEVRGSLSDVR
jgi:hypothetical protein